jgi:hypothetical protein
MLAAGCAGSHSPTSATTSTVVDVHGQFSGTYTVATCVADGGFTGFCEGAGFTAGTTLPISLSLTQSGSTVSGSVTLGSLTGTFQGTVSGGTLTGTATMTTPPNDGFTLTLSVANWNTTLTGDSLKGGFSLIFSTPSLSGSATLTATIAQLNR